MSYRFAPAFISLTAVLCLPACASRGGDVFAGSAEAQPEYGGGIQTRAIRAAPAARSAQNESRPLSELNTPDAIAAREAAARNTGGRPVAAAGSGSQSASATAATEAVLAASTGKGNSHSRAPALQKGGKVRVRNGAALHSRPNASSEKLLAINIEGELELGPQVYNADGYWWYVQVGKETGWLLQTDILR